MPHEHGNGVFRLRLGKVRIELHGFRELLPRAVHHALVQIFPTSQVMLVGIQVRLVRRDMVGHDFRHHRGRHHIRDFGLDREDVL